MTDFVPSDSDGFPFDSTRMIAGHTLENHRPAAHLRNLVATTQESIALTLGICQSTVGKSERAGSGISVRTLERLCNALGFRLQLVIRR